MHNCGIKILYSPPLSPFAEITSVTQFSDCFGVQLKHNMTYLRKGWKPLEVKLRAVVGSKLILKQQLDDSNLVDCSGTCDTEALPDDSKEKYRVHNFIYIHTYV